MIWKHLKFSVARRKLPTFPTESVGNGCKIEAEHTQMNVDTEVKDIRHKITWSAQEWLFHTWHLVPTEIHRIARKQPRLTISLGILIGR